MSSNERNERKDVPDDLGEVAVEPLTDDDLETVAGGSVGDPIVNNARTGCQTNNASSGCC